MDTQDEYERSAKVNDCEAQYDGGSVNVSINANIDPNAPLVGASGDRCTFLCWNCHETAWKEPPCCFCFPFELGIRIHIWFVFLGVVCLPLNFF